MKVLIIAPNISKPYLGPSAVAYNTLRGFLKIDKELKSNGVEITFLSINDEIKRKEVTENIEIIGSKRFPLVTFTGEIQALINRMRNRMGNFDVVHSHNLYELAPWLFKKKSIKIYHLHGLAWKEKKYSGFFANIWVPLYEVRLKLYWNKFNKIVTVSQYNLSELSKKGFEVNNVLVIENPVSEEFFKVNKNFENMILYPAGLTPRKNHIGFLRALSLIKESIRDFKVVITGTGNKKYIKKLRNIIIKENLNNITFTGRIPYDKLLELYSRASIVTLLSFEESFGMAIAEAMATGTPVLASSIPVFRYIVKENETGLLADPNDPKDIAEKLLALINDESLRKRIGREARKEAERRWRAEIVAKKHLELYLSL